MSQTQENAPQVRITISEVLSLLDQGKSRKEIALHFGQTQTAMQRMVWSNPKLKAKKAKKQYSDEIMLVDDIAVEEVEVKEAPVEEEIGTEVAPIETDVETEEAVEKEDADSPQWN